MEPVKIVALCVAALVVYGVLHDQITTRVCLEYFTIGHPQIFGTQSPTLLALGWGIIATSWAGLTMGVFAVIAPRAGALPKFTAAQLFRPVCVLLIAMGCASALSGVLGYLLAESGRISLQGRAFAQIPESSQSAFAADLWAHEAAYIVGILGGFIVCAYILILRWQSVARM